MKTVTEIPLRDVDGNKVMIKVQRPRIMAMAAQGKIPNPLLGVASKMMSGKQIKSDNIKEIAQMIELYCRACMVEPKYEDANLDDNQMLEIFSWATADVDDLATFRDEPENSQPDSDVEGVSDQAEPAAGD